jgi:hypothetical protein
MDCVTSSPQILNFVTNAPALARHRVEADEPAVQPHWNGQALFYKGEQVMVLKGAARVLGLIAMRNLNRKLKQPSLRFFRDRSGTGICWEPCET